MLADVGFGEGFVEPLPLRDGVERRERGHLVGLVRRDDTWVYRERRDGEDWRDRFVFTTTPHPLTDFAARNEWQQTSPDSHFTRSRLASVLTATGRVTLSGDRLITTSPGRRKETVLADEDAVRAILADRLRHRPRLIALVGASAAIAAAIGPLLGGFVTTYLSWRVGFALEVVIIVVVLSQIRLVRDVAYTGSRKVDVVGAVLSVLGMGGVVLGILVWQEGGQYVGLLMAVGAVALVLLARWLIRRKRAGQVTLLDPDLFRHPNFTAGVSGQLLQQVTLGGAMIALPLYFQMTLEYNALQSGLSLAPLSLTMFAAALVAGRRAGNRRPASIIRAGFVLTSLGVAIIIPLVPRADSGWYFVVPLAITGCGLGLLVSQLNNYTLAPVEEERVSEAAGVNSAAGSFGLSFGLAMAGGLMLAALSLGFTQLAQSSSVIPAAQQQQISQALEHDAEIMSNSQLEQQISGQPAEVEAEVVAINAEARDRSLQIALLVPLLAGLLGLANSFRMLRLPDQKPSTSLDGLDFG